MYQNLINIIEAYIYIYELVKKTKKKITFNMLRTKFAIKKECVGVCVCLIIYIYIEHATKKKD